MGTNFYYIKFTRCESCGHVEQEEIHIGKSSFGWKFHFAYDSFEIPEEWKEELKGKYLFDEYNEEISYEAFLDLVEKKQTTIEKPSPSELKMREDFPRYAPVQVNGYEFYRGAFS